MKRWHVIQTKVRQEQKALENLQRQGYVCFLPTLRREKIVRQQVCVVTEPLFAHYLFIQLEHATHTGELYQQNWAPIRSTLGVKNLVRFGSQPATLPDALVCELMQYQEQQQQARPKSFFQANETVTITKGAFAGVSGIYQRLITLENGQTRAHVLIELLHQQTLLPVAPALLKKMNA